MDYKGVNKRTYKELKKEIVRDTALNVGYYPKVINEINNDVLLDTIKEISLNGWITEKTKDIDLQNMIVTEAVRKMSYQEFKDIADNFFSFVPDDEEKYYKASKLEVTRENYDYLVTHTKRAFGLEKKLNEIEKDINSLDNKINSLETTIVKSGDEVIGIDIDREEILLLKYPTNSYIDEDVVIAEEIINNYRSSKDDYTQILDYLIDNYKEINLLHAEYVLNNDKCFNSIGIDYYDIEEIYYNDITISDFKTQKDFYNYATRFNSFNEKYNSYEDYIIKWYDSVYSHEDLPNYSEDILKTRKKEIDQILEKYDTMLIMRDIYDSQRESWTIGYLADIEDDLGIIEDYIENYLGSWYKGSLTELQIIPFDSFEKGKFVGEVNSVYYVDYNLLPYNDNILKDIKNIFPELENFKTKEQALAYINQKEHKSIEKTERGLSI